MHLLAPVADRSKDPNTQVGCIIVGADDNNIRTTGYNSFPRGIRDDVPERFERPEKYYWIEHADRNAIYSAARNGPPLNKSRMYLPGLPCMDCGRAIIQVGIIEVIYDGLRQAAWAKTTPKYVPDFERVGILLSEANVKLTAWYESKDIEPINSADGKTHHQ